MHQAPKCTRIFIWGKIEKQSKQGTSSKHDIFKHRLNDSWKPSLKQGRGSLTNRETITSIDPYVFRNLAIIFKWEGSLPLHPQFITSHKALDLSPAYHYRQTQYISSALHMNSVWGLTKRGATLGFVTAIGRVLEDLWCHILQNWSATHVM